MNILLNLLLILNALTEGLAAAGLIGGPDGISAAGAGQMWSMHYGFAALAIASISIWVWPHRHQLQPITIALGTLLVFHTGLCASLALAGDQAAGMAAHGLLAIMCVILFVQRRAFAEA